MQHPKDQSVDQRNHLPGPGSFSGQRRLDVIEAPLKIFWLYLYFVAVKCIMEVLCGQIVVVLNNFLSTTSLYALTGRVRGLKILA